MGGSGLGRVGSRQRTILIGIGLLGVAVGLIIHLTAALDRAESSTIDTRFQVRGEREPPADMVVVAIDDVTFSELGVQWPFPRRLHAKLIDALVEAGVEQIAYDVQFTEQTTARDDNALINAIGRAPGTVLSTTEVDEDGSHGVLGGEELLDSLGARAGCAGIELGEGGVLRQVLRDCEGLPSLAFALAEARIGELPPPFPDEPWVDYPGPPGTVPEVSFSRVLRDQFARGSLKGKTALVGATAPSLQDLHRVPTDDAEMSGVEYWAAATATIEDDFPLRSTGVVVDLLLILALGLLPVPLFRRLTPLAALAGTTAAGIAYLIAVQASFNAGAIVPVIAPMAGLIASGAGSLGASYVFEAFERQRTRDTFGRFVSPSVVEEVMGMSDGLRLGGRRFEVTVLFSDIRGFTTFSETRPPEEVMDILNRYLGSMADAILAEGGTISSFIGDGIMAVFGAPVAQTDHADRALSAAREMLGPKLEAFNEWARGAGIEEPFRMGVGLNSGPVMSGMVGSATRLDYTAIGDTVNTAARLEGMTKGTAHQLFISESTKQRLASSKAMDELEFVGEMDVRGREHGVGVWALPRG